MSRALNNSKNHINSQTQSSATHLFSTNIISSAVKALKYQHIAPAPPGHGLDGKSRKYMARTSNLPYNVDQTQSVQRRNARERNRVKQVNNSFVRLRQHIPQSIITDLTKGGGRGPHKKISKVDTLRIAVEYIRRLQDLVDDLNGSGVSGGFSSPASDTASNSSFISNSSSSSNSSNISAIDSQTQLFYSTVAGNNSPNLTQTVFQQKDQHQQSKQQQQHQQQHQQFPSGLLTPVSLNAYSPRQGQHDTECNSPTSSFNSSLSSFESGSFEQPPTNNANNSHNIGGSGSGVSQSHLDAHLQLKFEPYENFNLHEEDCTPDDEEILDYISLWQEE